RRLCFFVIRRKMPGTPEFQDRLLRYVVRFLGSSSQGALALCCVFTLAAQASPRVEPLSIESGGTSNAAPVTSGEELARIWCSGCHVFPEPDLLDKKTWIEQTLPRMKIRLGLSPGSLEMSRESALLKATGLIPEEPKLPAEDFQKIVAYFAATAPEH